MAAGEPATWNPAGLDWRRLSAYAKKAAAGSASIPSSTLSQRTVLGKKGWLRPTTEVAWTTVDLRGWILLVDRVEGIAESLSAPRPHTWCNESGRLLLLRRDGVLWEAEYELGYIERHPDTQLNGTSTQLTNERQVTAQSAPWWDRTNRGGYKPRRSTLPNTVWARELGSNWRVHVPYAGMATSLALKRLLEERRYERTVSVSL